MDIILEKLQKFASVEETRHNSYEIYISRPITENEMKDIEEFEILVKAKGKKGVIISAKKLGYFAHLNKQFEEVGEKYYRLKTIGMEIPTAPYMTNSIQAIIYNDKKEIVVIKTKRGYGFVQGGSREGGDLMETMKREIKEEAGIVEFGDVTFGG